MIRYKSIPLLAAAFFLFLAACDKAPGPKAHPPLSAESADVAEKPGKSDLPRRYKRPRSTTNRTLWTEP